MLDLADQLLKDLIALCPDFSQTWADEAYLWTDQNGKPRSACGVFAAFSHYIGDILIIQEQPDLQMVFDFAELCMAGDDEISTAVATCFLENLMNRTPWLIAPGRFVPLLGQESRDYCKAWDEFCGVKTVGLL